MLCNFVSQFYKVFKRCGVVSLSKIVSLFVYTKGFIFLRTLDNTCYNFEENLYNSLIHYNRNSLNFYERVNFFRTV